MATFTKILSDTKTHAKVLLSFDNDTALTALVNTKDANVSNYVRATSNYLKGAIDAIVLTGGGYDDTALRALVNTNDTNVSNYVRTTSNTFREGVPRKEHPRLL